MWRIAVIIIILICAACNLSTSQPTDTPSPPTDTALPPITNTPVSSFPNVVPIPGMTSSTQIAVTRYAVTSIALVSGMCDVFTTYSGTDPNNLLSLRDAPSVSGVQVFRVPTNVEVLRVPGSSEVEADGYHWLNVIYVESPAMRMQGWMARDSYSRQGVRDPSIATLRPTGRQVAC